MLSVWEWLRSHVLESGVQLVARQYMDGRVVRDLGISVRWVKEGLSACACVR